MPITSFTSLPFRSPQIAGASLTARHAPFGRSRRIASATSAETFARLVGAVDLGAGRLGAGTDDDLVDVDVRGQRGDPADALGDVLGPQRVHPLVDAVGRLRLPAEADDRELGLDHPGGD